LARPQHRVQAEQLAFERVGDVSLLKPTLTPWLEALAINTKKPASCGFFVEFNEYIILILIAANLQLMN
jgi:hypothetical protein